MKHWLCVQGFYAFCPMDVLRGLASPTVQMRCSGSCPRSHTASRWRNGGLKPALRCRVHGLSSLAPGHLSGLLGPVCPSPGGANQFFPLRVDAEYSG